MPEVSLSAGFGFSAELGLAEDDVVDPAATLEKLRGTLTGQPSDAAKHLQAARLLRRLRDDAAARTELEAAIQAFRRRVSLQPDDSAALTGLGEALAASGQIAEAESVLREATRKVPGDWRAWCALGRFLQTQAGSELLRGTASPSPAGTSAQANVPRPTPERLERSRRWNDEARACFDKAVNAGPKEARPLADRAGWRSSVATQEVLIRQALGQTDTDVPNQLVPFTTNALPDLQAASALAPRDFRLHAAVVWFSVLGYWRTLNDLGRSLPSWEDLPNSVRETTRRHQQALENLSEDPDPQVASGALENLALVKLLLLRDPVGGAVAAQRAVRREPARRQAWDLLVGSLASQDRFDELQSLLEERLRTHPDPRTFFMLGKVYARRERWEEAERPLRVGLGMASQDPLLRLALACVTLRAGSDSRRLSIARDQLEGVSKVLAKHPDPEERLRWALHAGVSSAILLALEGNVDDARAFLRSIQAGHEDDPYLKSVVEILGE